MRALTDLVEVWNWSRIQLDEAVEGLSGDQLAWRLYAAAHNIQEICYHVAGSEHYWASRILGRDPRATPFEALLDQAVLEGFLREDVGGPFRSPEEGTPEAIENALAFTRNEFLSCVENASVEQRQMEIVGPAGERIQGSQALARVAQHVAYHTGQIWLIAMSPKFPVS